MAAKKSAAKKVEPTEPTTEELVNEVMAVLFAMSEDDRVEVFQAISEVFDLETGEELDEEDDEDDEDEDEEDDEDDEDEDEDDEDGGDEGDPDDVDEDLE